MSSDQCSSLCYSTNQKWTANPSFAANILSATAFLTFVNDLEAGGVFATASTYNFKTGNISTALWMTAEFSTHVTAQKHSGKTRQLGGSDIIRMNWWVIPWKIVCKKVMLIPPTCIMCSLVCTMNNMQRTGTNIKKLWILWIFNNLANLHHSSGLVHVFKVVNIKYEIICFQKNYTGENVTGQIIITRCATKTFFWVIQYLSMDLFKLIENDTILCRTPYNFPVSSINLIWLQWLIHRFPQSSLNTHSDIHILQV